MEQTLRSNPLHAFSSPQRKKKTKSLTTIPTEERSHTFDIISSGESPDADSPLTHALSSDHLHSLSRKMRADRDGMKRFDPFGQYADLYHILSYAEKEPNYFKAHTIFKNQEPIEIVTFVGKSPRAKEVGFWIDPDSRGHGVATNAVKNAITQVMTDEEIHELRANPSESNLASIAVLERLDFREDHSLGISKAARKEQALARRLLLEETGETIKPFSINRSRL